jgi:hypothetical protein
MVHLSSRKSALLGIIAGIILVSIANDEILLIQAQTPAQKQFAQFCVGFATLVSAMVAILISTKIIHIRPNWANFITGLSGTATLINITFVTILPQIFTWLKT